MAKVVRCEDGVVIQGETAAEIVEKVLQHITEAHPGLIGKLSNDEILAMAKDVA
jgi:predicted small metal-binding protein